MSNIFIAYIFAMTSRGARRVGCIAVVRAIPLPLPSIVFLLATIDLF